jgi:threonylcarbamoyladenosine tRNA methylthiotransferase MtaB
MKKFKIVTLGCRTNQYESEGYAKQLRELGLVEAREEESADLCIVNTCTVTHSADSSSRHKIRQLVKRNPGSKVIVTGCLAERAPEELIKIGGVAQIVPNKEKERLLTDLFPGQELPEFSIETFTAHTRAFVKVQDGCNSFCTYCIIPYVRGRSRSRPVNEIVREIKSLVANGYKEVVITGINVGDFDGGGEKVSLAELIKKVDDIEGLERIRVSSIDPDEVDEALADAVLLGKKTCHSMHIVLQSGSNIILKKMNRKYTKQIFSRTIDYLKGRSPDFTFTTDIIVGFPGESDADFQDTLEMVEKVKFAKVHVFPYSDRPRTRANLYPNKVPNALMEERKQQLLRSTEQNSFSLRQSFIGRKMKVLIESEDPARPGSFLGHTDNFLLVSTPGSFKSNDLVEVTLVDNAPDALIGKR